MPFTPDQFFGVFAEYNLALFPALAALWLAGIAAMAFTARRPAERSQALTLFLGGLWLWNAVAYHAWFFTRINNAAWLFAAMFALQALLFVHIARGERVEYFRAGGWRRAAGVSLIVYACSSSPGSC
jgi:hypothetical protein